MVNIKTIKKNYKYMLILLIILSLSIVNAAYTQKLTITGQGHIEAKKTLDRTNDKCEIVKGTGYDMGDEVLCATEPFYVIENTEEHLILLAKYYLNVGYTLNPDYDPNNYNFNDSSNWTPISSPTYRQSSWCHEASLPRCNVSKCPARTCDDHLTTQEVSNLYLSELNKLGLDFVKSDNISTIDISFLKIANCNITENQTVYDNSLYYFDGDCPLLRSKIEGLRTTIDDFDRDNTKKLVAPHVLSNWSLKSGGYDPYVPDGYWIYITID